MELFLAIIYFKLTVYGVYRFFISKRRYYTLNSRIQLCLENRFKDQIYIAAESTNDDLTYTAENHRQHFYFHFMNFDYHCGEVCRNHLFDMENMDLLAGYAKWLV